MTASELPALLNGISRKSSPYFSCRSISRKKSKLLADRRYFGESKLAARSLFFARSFTRSEGDFRQEQEQEHELSASAPGDQREVSENPTMA